MVTDEVTKQKIARLFFPEKLVLDNSNISNMIPDSIKVVFGLGKFHNRGSQNKKRIKKDNEEIIRFLRGIFSLDFEKVYRQF